MVYKTTHSTEISALKIYILYKKIVFLNPKDGFAHLQFEQNGV